MEKEQVLDQDTLEFTSKIIAHQVMTTSGAINLAIKQLIYEITTTYIDAFKKAATNQVQFEAQEGKMLVELEWDPEALGPAWMNEGNLETLFYSYAKTSPDFLKYRIIKNGNDVNG